MPVLKRARCSLILILLVTWGTYAFSSARPISISNCETPLALSADATISLDTLAEPHYPSLTDAIGVIDIGSSTLKVMVLDSNAKLRDLKIRIALGRDLGKQGFIGPEAEAHLVAALREARQFLNSYGVAEEHTKVVATAGLRDAANGQEIAARLSLPGQKIEIISEIYEAELVYRSTIESLDNLPRDPLIIEVGGGSTEIVRGDGPSAIQIDRSRTLHFGSSRLQIANVFSARDIAAAIAKLKSTLKTEMPENLLHSAAGELAIIGKGPVYQTFIKAHNAAFPSHTIQDHISLPMLRYYTSALGLRALMRWQEAHPEDGDIYQQIAVKLSILRAIAEEMQLAGIRVGSKGGMKKGLVVSLAESILKQRFALMTESLMKHFSVSELAAVGQIEKILPPGSFGQLISRSKGESTLNKLIKKGIEKRQEIRVIQQALQAVADGVGIRLILKDTRPETMNALFNNLRAAVAAGKIRITEINNYRGPGAAPYLSDDRIYSLVRAAATHGQSIRQPNEDELIRPSGYTTLQMNIAFENGVEGELQIRGSTINWLAELEHIFYDLRMGKLGASASPKQRSLQMAFQSLSTEESDAYSQYFRQYYVWAREQESGLQTPAPKLPAILAAHPELSVEFIRALLASVSTT